MKKTIITFVVICGLSFSLKVFAFDNFSTHPALTERAIEVYNSNAQTQLSKDEKRWVIEGSVLEDTWPRWVNHFYDPVNKVGWTGNEVGGWSAVLASIAPGFIAPDNPIAAVDWIKNPIVQQEYERYGGVRTWQKALDYYANGNKEEAYKTLGFVLHILEDMGVPDHTRNDTHIEGSPFEGFASRWNQEHLPGLPSGLISKYSTPEEYLNRMAEYSNRYFFSPDTVTSYSKPTFKVEDGVGYGLDENNSIIPLIRVTYKKNNGSNGIQSIYQLKNVPEDEFIFNSYFSHLAPKIILNGAGLIDLFQKKAEEAVVNKEFPTRLVKVNEDFLPSGFSLVGEYGRLKEGVSSMFAKISGLFGKAEMAPTTLEDRAKAVASKTISHDSGLDDEGYIVWSPHKEVSNLTVPAAKTAAKAVVSPQISSVIVSEVPQKITYVNRGYVPVAVTAELQNTNSSSSNQVVPDDKAATTTDELSSTTTSTVPTEATSTLEIIPNDLNLIGEYDPNGPSFNLHWDYKDGEKITLSFLNASGTWENIFEDLPGMSSYSYYIRELGRIYRFKVISKDIEGVTRSGYAEIESTPFMTLALYKQAINGTEKYVADMSLNPSYFPSAGGGWDLRMLQFYLNEEPLKNVDIRDIWQGGPSNVSFSQSRCSGYSGMYKDLIIALPMGYCFYGGPASSAYANYEENRIILETDIDPNRVLGGDDFIKVVLYRYAGWNQYGIVGEDVNRFHFGSPIPKEPPFAPGTSTINFDPLKSKISVLVGTSTDPDSADAKLKYEVAVSTTSDSFSWKSVDNWPMEFRVVWPNRYFIATRAVDEFGNRSESTVYEWDFPEDYVAAPGQFISSDKIGGDKGFQSFYIDKSIGINGITLLLGGDYPYWQYNSLKIFADNSGTPGEVVATSREASYTPSPETKAYTYNFEPTTLQDKTRYWIGIVQRDPDENEKLWVFGSSQDEYSGGAWSQGGDAYFELNRI